MNRYGLIAVAVLAMGCSGDATPYEPVCTLADTGSPCASLVITAEIKNGNWVVTIPVTTEKEVSYVDNGVQCVRYARSCSQQTCNIGPASALTRDEAIAWCRSR